ncbi:MAG: aminotransferase class IV [Chthoniobacterales bacterium]
MKKNLSWSFRRGQWQKGAEIPIEDRGFRFGMHVFETLSVRAGKPHHFGYHIDALRAAAAHLRVQDAFLEKALPDFQAAGFLPPCDGTLRFFLTFGSGPPTSAPNQPGLFAWFEPGDFKIDRRTRCVGLKQISSDPFFLQGVKTGNYAWRCALYGEAQATDLDDFILYTGRDKVLISGVMSNIAVRLKGCWVTPDATSGCRRGVVRRYLLEKNWITERRITVSDLECLEAAMLFNSRKGLCSISIQGIEVAKKTQKNFQEDEQIRDWNEAFWREGF